MPNAGNGKTFEMLTKLRQLRTHICACLCIFSFSQFTVAAIATRRPYGHIWGVRMWSKCQLQNNCILVTLLLNPEFRWQPPNKHCDGFRWHQAMIKSEWEALREGILNQINTKIIWDKRKMVRKLVTKYCT